MIIGCTEKNRYEYVLCLQKEKFNLYINTLTNRNTFIVVQSMDNLLKSYGHSIKHRQFLLL